jgi:hypothetical protein
VFWFMNPAQINQDVVNLLAEPDIAGDPAGGLISKLPPKAFLK